MDMSGVNSFISRTQMQNAMQVTQANISSLKTKKDIDNNGVDDELDAPGDEISLSAAAEPTQEQEMAAAENSGDLAQVDPQLKNRDSDRIERGSEHARYLAEKEGDQALNQTGESAGTQEPLLCADLDDVDRGPRRSDQEVIRDLMSDMPDDIKRVSGEMVTNQIRGTQPASSLTKLHNIPEPAAKELGAVGMLSEPLDIHDLGNLPMPLHLEEATV